MNQCPIPGQSRFRSECDQSGGRAWSKSLDSPWENAEQTPNVTRPGKPRYLHPAERTDVKTPGESTDENVSGSSLARISAPVLPTGHVFVYVFRRVAGFLRTDSDLFELAIQRRSPDFKATRDLGHLPAIARDRKANHLGFDLLQRPDISGRIGEGERVGARATGGVRDVRAHRRSLFEHQRRRADGFGRWSGQFL